MPCVRYLAILAEDPASVASFYRDAFAMRDLGGSPAGDITLTDGTINMTIFRLRPELGEPRMEPGLHRIGIEVGNLERVKARFRRHNPRGVMVPESGGLQYGELRFYDAESFPVSLSQRRFGVPPGPEASRLLHIGFDVLDPAAACEFYVRVFGFVEQPASSGGIAAERPDRAVTDGHISLGFHHHYGARGAHRPRYGISHLQFRGDAGPRTVRHDPAGNQIDVVARATSPVA